MSVARIPARDLVRYGLSLLWLAIKLFIILVLVSSEAGPMIFYQYM